MNGKERFIAAFSENGTPEIPVCICYEHIFIRDHWKQLTEKPWWQMYSPFDEDKYCWQKDVSKKIDQDWVIIPIGLSEEGIKKTILRKRNNSFSIVNDLTRKETNFSKDIIGDKYAGSLRIDNNKKIAETYDEVELLFEQFCNLKKSVEVENDTATAFFYKPINRIGEKGFKSLPEKIINNWGKRLFPIHYLRDPVFLTYRIWGMEGMIMKMVDNPKLFKYACELFTKYTVDLIDILAKINISAIWLSCNLIGMINNEEFRKHNLPYLQTICEKAKEKKIKVIINFLGNIKNKWDIVLNCNADGLAFEEGKKGFDNSIEEIIERVKGRFVLFGNIDPIWVLERGKLEDLRDQIKIQIKSGRKNKNRFVMCLEGPITPTTNYNRVKEFINIARQVGGQR